MLATMGEWIVRLNKFDVEDRSTILLSTLSTFFSVPVLFLLFLFSPNDAGAGDKFVTRTFASWTVMTISTSTLIALGKISLARHVFFQALFIVLLVFDAHLGSSGVYVLVSGMFAFPRYASSTFPEGTSRRAYVAIGTVLLSCLILKNTAHRSMTQVVMNLGVVTCNQAILFVLDEFHRRELCGKQFALQKALQKTETALKTKEQFIAKINHQIRTPMNGILGLLEALQQQGDRSNTTLEMLRGIHVSAHSLLYIVNDMLDFSKQEAQAVALSPKPFILSNLLQGTIATFQSTAEKKGIELCLEVDDALRSKTFFGDEGKIRRVLVSFCSNAIFYTSFSGKVTVKVAEMHHAEEEDDGSSPPNTRLQFSVKDTGVGIAEKERAFVFSPFYQSPSTIQHGGLGILLYVFFSLPLFLNDYRPRLHTRVHTNLGLKRYCDSFHFTNIIYLGE